MNRVVITGMELITALGPTLETTWKRLIAGESAVAPITYFDASEYGCTVAAEVRNPSWPHAVDESLTGCRRGVRLFTTTARGAWRDAGLDRDTPRPDQVGVAAGVSVNYVNMAMIRHHFSLRGAGGRALDLGRFAREGGCEPPHLFAKRQGELAATLPARELGATGPTIAIDTACAASASAISHAFRVIRRGRA